MNTHPFRECVLRDPYLAALRSEYARTSPTKRRAAADWEYHSSIATRMFNAAIALTGAEGLPSDDGFDGCIALAIDPLYAPALLTVGTIEHQLGRPEEAMRLFLTLTTLPESEEDLPEIIDKAGDFLLDNEEYRSAAELYAAAAKAFPDVALYHSGLSYCHGKMNAFDEALSAARKTVELEPDDYYHLNDLGWTLFEAGRLDEAKSVLEQSVALSPAEYVCSRNNLKTVLTALAR